MHAGATPIFIAAYRGYIDIVAFLIKQKANLETPNSKGFDDQLNDCETLAAGNTPFFICCQHCRLDIASMLVVYRCFLILAECWRVDCKLGGRTCEFRACQRGWQYSPFFCVPGRNLLLLMMLFCRVYFRRKEI